MAFLTPTILPDPGWDTRECLEHEEHFSIYAEPGQCYDVTAFAGDDETLKAKIYELVSEPLIPRHTSAH